MSELYSYPSNDYRSYLAHHGVKGMRWGHRKERYEAKRKAKYMKKYGVTSKQYDSVREKSLERHKKGNKVRNVFRVGNAIDKAIDGYKQGRNYFNAATKYSKVNSVSTPIETVRGIEGMTIGGTIANVVISDAILKREWELGRRIVDRVLETQEFEQMNRRKQ